jgi:dihydrofolate reductase
VLLEGDVAQAVASLKQEDGPELQVHGSGDLLQTLIREGVVDEFQLLVFPVLVGSGKRLFAQGTVPASLKLIESRVSPSGVFIGRYQPAGELVTGTFGA